MTERKWADLDPDPAMVAALDCADAGDSRAVALAAGASTTNGWSNRLADACAVMVADGVRRHRTFRSLLVRPLEAGPAEPLTFVAGDRSKKVDVVVSSIVSGLQLGFSLKGMNFRDGAGMQGGSPGLQIERSSSDDHAWSATSCENSSSRVQRSLQPGGHPMDS